jgi:hypothetical protein
MLEACPAVLTLSMTIALLPPLSGSAAATVAGNMKGLAVGTEADITQPNAAHAAGLPEACTLKNIRSVVPFKSSVTGEQVVAAVARRSLPASTTAMVPSLLKEMRFSAG